MVKHVEVHYLLWFDMTEEGDLLSNGLVNGVSTPTHDLKHAQHVCRLLLQFTILLLTI